MEQACFCIVFYSTKMQLIAIFSKLPSLQKRILSRKWFRREIQNPKKYLKTTNLFSKTNYQLQDKTIYKNHLGEIDLQGNLDTTKKDKNKNCSFGEEIRSEIFR